MTRSKVFQDTIDSYKNTLYDTVLNKAISYSHNYPPSNSTLAYSSFIEGAKAMLELLNDLESNRIAEVGEFIVFTFEDSDSYSEYYRGKSFVGEVGFVNMEQKEYGVFTEYGQDYVDFSKARLLSRKISLNQKIS